MENFAACSFPPLPEADSRAGGGLMVIGWSTWRRNQPTLIIHTYARQRVHVKTNPPKHVYVYVYVCDCTRAPAAVSCAFEWFQLDARGMKGSTTYVSERGRRRGNYFFLALALAPEDHSPWLCLRLRAYMDHVRASCRK